MPRPQVRSLPAPLEPPPDDWGPPPEALTPETLDEIERKVEQLEHTLTEIERLSEAMARGMYHHYRRRSG